MSDSKQHRKRSYAFSGSESQDNKTRDRSSSAEKSSRHHRHSGEKHKHKKKRRKHKDSHHIDSEAYRNSSYARSPKKKKHKQKDHDSSKDRKSKERGRSRSILNKRSRSAGIRRSRSSGSKRSQLSSRHYSEVSRRNESEANDIGHTEIPIPANRNDSFKTKNISEDASEHSRQLSTNTSPELTDTAKTKDDNSSQKKHVELSNFRISSVLQPRKVVIPHDTSLKVTAFPSEDAITDQEKRRQRLKLWQEKLKCENNSMLTLDRSISSNDSNPVHTVNNKVRIEEAKEFTEPAEIVPTEVKVNDDTKSEGEQEKRQFDNDLDTIETKNDEVDPLDAFMNSLEGQAASQEVFDFHTENSLAKPRVVSNFPTSISFEEIELLNKKVEANAFGSFIPPSSVSDIDDLDSEEMYPDPKTAEFNYGGITPQRVEETDEQRELREEIEHREFMEAIRREREKEVKKIFEPQDLNIQQRQEDIDSKNEDISAKDELGLGRIYQGVDEDLIGEESAQADTRSALEILQESQKKKEIKAVDHSKIEYAAFQKKFYIEPKEIKNLGQDEVESIRERLEIKIRGRGCQRPIETWAQCGFSNRLLKVIEKQKYEQPFAIQRQALPVIMSGRDVIGIAKTGSGKTLAFLLPMFRHISHQPPLGDGEGPIGLVMAPARELALQIYNEAKKFTKDLGFHVTAIYGGAGVAEQIANLKRGSDIVVCTPGRMIDILCMNAGKLISLKRITYVVLDEADRMFDMGFEPQITKILTNIRPDRQTLLFSATFPRQVESLARKALTRPIEITVGSRNTASGDIKQYVEVREEKDKFMRLLQLLGIWYEKGNVLVFVNTQQACDQLFQDLMKAGYPALSLHGGKEQMDRDYTIDDFKRKIRTLMVATSVAGRGLDVKDLVLVINYHCPNHIEDYVHRVGRTGRAGNKGTAYTFISQEEEAYSLDLLKALESGKQEIPKELLLMGESFKMKVSSGIAKHHGSGFTGKGFTFDQDEKSEAQIAADLQKRQYEIEQGIIDPTEYRVVEDELEVVEGDISSATTGTCPIDTSAAVASAAERAKALAKEISSGKSNIPASDSLAAVKKAHQIAQILDLQYRKKQIDVAEATGVGHFEEEIEINDYPQQARWKVTQKEASESITELTGAAIIARGSFVPSGRKPNPGERKLYLAIEGPTLASVLDAKREIQRVLDETILQVGLGGEKYSKYTI